MKTSDFYYDLPEELIAQDPLFKRSDSRLMVLDKVTGEITHSVFNKITDYLREGDCLVINNTKVIPARLIGQLPSGKEAEVLLLKRKDADVWETIVRPGKKLRAGATVSFGDGMLQAVVEDVLEDGNRLVRFIYEGIFSSFTPPTAVSFIFERGAFTAFT